MSNYIKIEKWSLLYRYYAYVDVSEYLADSIFFSEKIWVHFMKEYRKNDCKYAYIFCKIRKKEEDGFLKSLDRLKNKIIINGYTDYAEFCENMHSVNVNIKMPKKWKIKMYIYPLSYSSG